MAFGLLCTFLSPSGGTLTCHRGNAHRGPSRSHFCAALLLPEGMFPLVNLEQNLQDACEKRVMSRFRGQLRLSCSCAGGGGWEGLGLPLGPSLGSAEGSYQLFTSGGSPGTEPLLRGAAYSSALPPQGCSWLRVPSPPAGPLSLGSDDDQRQRGLPYAL